MQLGWGQARGAQAAVCDLYQAVTKGPGEKAVQRQLLWKLKALPEC